MSNDRSSEAPDAGASRRGFLARAGAMAGGLLAVRAAPAAASTVPPAETGAPAILRHGLGSQQVVTRYDVTTFTEGSQRLTSLKNGVRTMMQRPASDPTSWLYQANIHAIFCDNPPAGTTAVHYSWRFLPWHRAYLYYFEKIVRAASGDPTLSLPYWNWSVNLKIPPQYWGTGNPLFDPRRTKGPNDQLNPARTAINNLLGVPTFPQFGGSEPEGEPGALEVGPHNYVHGWIGGDMGAFDTAARDPVFWAHHANVDRVWFLWNQRGHGNPADPAWLNTSYPFYDIDRGANVNVTFAQAAAFPVTYAAPPAQVLAVADPQGVRPVTGQETTAPVALQAATVASVLGVRPPTATLRVVGVNVPRTAPVTVDVFASAPGTQAGAPTANRALAGHFTLVPTGPNHAMHGPVNPHVALGAGFVRALSAQVEPSEAALGAAPANVSFTLAPSTEDGPARETLSYDRLELHLP